MAKRNPTPEESADIGPETYTENPPAIMDEPSAALEESHGENETPLVVESNTAKPAELTGGFCVYLGPSIRGVIQGGTVYPRPKEQVVAELDEVIKKYPQIKQLVVSGEMLAAEREKVRTPGNLLNVYYNQLAFRNA